MTNEIQFKDDAHFLQRFSPKILWHFTGYSKADEEAFDRLKNIISTNTLKVSSETKHIRLPFLGIRTGFPCSCMCDIPFKDLYIHTCRYNEFGIAFNKISAIKNGFFNPVLYIQHDHPFVKYFADIAPILDTLSKDPHCGIVVNSFLNALGSYSKPCDLTKPFVIPDINIKHDDYNFDFSYEKEWVSIKDWNFDFEDIELILVPKSYLDKLLKFLNDTVRGKIPFLSADMIEKL